eukprot:CAMPEP_0117428924 /NCGR_PEP_ID=MMETSP0758-20121206/8528_1 /TAXON_ID=63605 /ORGANISM="Percolomonas cosmopolitus, Strain AE-1 (ATCC 50343)" /LENGTH=268 /DNA_ID=CAMNT_0005215559 /DNA_START=230 /DNA_END=1036 /DNA_ORIENTATION=+
MTLIKERESMVVIGGKTTGRKVLNTTWEFSLRECQWTKTTDFREGRINHAAVCVYPYIYVYGGVDGKGSRRSEMKAYHVEKQEWKKIKEKDKDSRPSCRSRHSMVYYNGDLIVFGGRRQHVDNNELHAFSLSKKCWRPLESHNPPVPRSAHTALVVNDNMVVYGGFGYMHLRDLHHYHFLTQQWQEIQLCPRPMGRNGHSMTLRWPTRHESDQLAKLVVFGGFTELRGSTNEFFDLPINDRRVTHRRSCLAFQCALRNLMDDFFDVLV